jgi:hypothetical protein
VVASPSPSIWSGGEVDFTIRNQVSDIALMRGICHVSSGEKDGDFSVMILPMGEASVKVKAAHMIAGRIECCLVYELIDQKNESEPFIEGHQVFIAVRVFARSFINSYKASAVMFMARKNQFIGSEDDINQLKKGILRKHSANNTSSFDCAIKTLMLRLEAVFYPGKHASIEVTLKEATEYTKRDPVFFE